jgi:hypothetical protein
MRVTGTETTRSGWWRGTTLHRRCVDGTCRLTGTCNQDHHL